jgi:restriction system protein
MGDGIQTQVDISYHYPPELLELLCDAVPVLFRSKQGVIDFFVGAGVPSNILADWKLKQDKEKVKKHEMARSILCRLNDVGEPALAHRREVLRRIAEFEDFSRCWENDRYKAQGLVSQIQKVVNVKDSFTRINLEREKERKRRMRRAWKRNRRKRSSSQYSRVRFTDCLARQTATSAENNWRAPLITSSLLRDFSSGKRSP